MMRNLIFFLSALSFFYLPGFDVDAKKTTDTFVNGQKLTAATISRLEKTHRIKIKPGRYWYDKKSGAWGVEGHGAAGVVPAGQNLGGSLKPNASKGNTGVFINGRELATSDVAGLQQYGIPVLRGRYWVDDKGDGGLEGQPRSFNLYALAQAAAQASGKGPWRRSLSAGGGNMHVGGDGSGFVYYIDSQGNSASSGP
ncbi:MAG: hypothetical protein AB1540_00415 [Bdellovibrionota bacterium]